MNRKNREEVIGAGIAGALVLSIIYVLHLLAERL